MERSAVHRWPLLRSLCASVVLMAALDGTVLAGIRYSAEFSEFDLSFSKEGGYDRVGISHYQTTSDAGDPESFGKPDLPVKLVNLIIPQGHEVASIHVDSDDAKGLSGTFKVYPSQPPIPNCEHCERPSFVTPDPLVYNSDEPYPSQLVEVKELGDFDGVNRIVTLVIYPLQYLAASGRLLFHARVSFSLETTPGRQSDIRPIVRDAVSSEVFQNALRSLVDNPEDIGRFGYSPPVRSYSEVSSAQKPSRTLSVEFYPYVVITSSALASSFADFVTWTSRKGIKAGVVTTADIYASYTGDGQGLDDDPGKIRGYLKDAYANHGTSWVLLGGDHDVVPVRYGRGHNNTTNANYISPTDVYYSDLNGDWEVDGDSYYGEPTQDTVDVSPEIYAGRLPCVSGTDIQNWTEKLLKYEQNPGNGSYSYLTKAFWVSADQNREEPDSNKTHVDGFSHTIYKELPTADSPSPTAYSGADVVTEMSNHYGFLNWHGHGAPNHFNTMTSGLNSSPRKGVWTTDGLDATETGDGLDNMTNADYYSVAYSICCEIAAFDDYLSGSYPGRSMAEGFTVSSKKGGPALLGNTRVGFYGMGSLGLSALLQQKFYDRVFDDNNYRVGVAEANSKRDISDHHLRLTHNLFSDPAMALWTSTPSTLSVTMTVTSSSVAVDAGVSGCTIAASSYDLTTYYQVSTNVQSATFNTSTRPLYIVVTKQNCIPYVAVTGGSLTSNQTWYGELLVHGDITVPSGKTLTIKPGTVVRFAANTDDQGGGPYASKCAIKVDGTLVADGTSTDKITFKSNSASPAAGDWEGIDFWDSSSDGTCKVVYAIIKHAVNGIYCSSATPSQLNNNEISQCTYGIVGTSMSTPTIQGNSLTSNLYGLYLASCTGAGTGIQNNTMTNNTTGLYLSSCTVKVYNSAINNNTYGAEVRISTTSPLDTCSFQSNGQWGIYAYGTSSPVLNDARVAYNGTYGLRMFNETSPDLDDYTHRNDFYHNGTYELYLENKCQPLLA